MKKILLLLVLLLGSVACEEESGSGSVYICTGSGAYAYHSNSGCRGLNNCQGSIISVSVSEAKKSRVPCKICY